MKLIEKNLAEVIKDVSSSSPAPGGGSVSAILGALGAALAEMVCKLTAGKKKFEAVKDEMEKNINILYRLRDELQNLIDLDADAFSDVVTAYKLPKETDEEKSNRALAISHATEKAIRVPLKTMELSLNVLELLPFIAQNGHPSSVSDVGVACIAAFGAIKGAFLNVWINSLDLMGLDHKEKAEEFLKTGKDIIQQAEEKYKTTMSLVEAKLTPSQ
ncbi:MAG: cyclodeaminase/cyclohydrolase family protein [bacterium]